jgi:S-DNA-T family DNA segregation ATPase FtsK/SpoIIIE
MRLRCNVRLNLLVDGVLAEDIANREFVLPLLHRLDRELARRGEIYRVSGIRDSVGYLNSGGAAMPSLLLNVEGLSDLFSEDDQLSQEASQMLDRFVRQGQSLGLVVKFN